MEIVLEDGSIARPAKQVTAVQLLKSQRLKLEAKRRVADDAEALAMKEERRVKELQGTVLQASAALDAHQAKLDASPFGLHAQPREDVELLRRLKEDLEFSKAELRVQMETAARERSKQLTAEQQVQVLERLSAKNAEVALRVEKREREDLASRKEVAERYIEMEMDAANTLETRHRRRIHAVQKASARDEELREEQARVAKKLNANARARVAATNATTERVLRDILAKKEEDHAERLECVLQLKASTDAAFAKMKGANERMARRRAAQSKAHKEEFQELLSQGKNPYKVFRERQLKAEAVATEREQREAIRRREQDVTERILREDSEQMKRQVVEDAHHEAEKKYQAELGRHVVEERNRQYLRSVTTNKTELVDPTGRAVLPLQPSQVTTIKDHSFGLGKNPRKSAEEADAIIQMVAAKPEHQGIDLGEYKRFLPKVPDGMREAQEGVRVAGGEGDELQDAAQERLAELADQNTVVVSRDTISQGDRGTRSGKATGGPGLGGEQKGLLESTRPLSKFELDCRKKAQERQRRQLAEGVAQVAGGRTFQGVAFTSEPPVIEFKDFEVGKTYHRRIVLTNVSLSFNAFKVLDLPDAIRDFFEISYAKPGRMSAGTTCAIDITFQPEVNADILDHLGVLAQTGPCDVPIRCTTKKVVPATDTDHVDFGEVVVGEVSTIKLRISNNGALPTWFEIMDSQTGELLGVGAPAGAAPMHSTGQLSKTSMQASQQLPVSDVAQGAHQGEEQGLSEEAAAVARLADEQAEAEAVLLEDAAAVAAKALEYEEGFGALQIANQGSIDSYSATLHEFVFAPLRPGRYEQPVTLKFSGTDTTIDLMVSGEAVLFPIYAEQPVVDMRTCVLGKLYRKKVTLCNRGKIAFKVQALVPRELQGMLDFTPDMGFVQPGSHFDMGLKFRPSGDLVARCQPFALEKFGVIGLPVRVLVPKQAIPVYFTLRAQLTPGDVETSVQDLDYGECYITESVRRRLTLTNTSSLPQRFGFVNLPSSLDVQPLDGFGVLLGGESRDVEVIFKPESSVAYDFSLKLKMSIAGEKRIPIRGKGVDPPLVLSQSVIELAPAADGDVVVASVEVKNTTSKTQEFHCVLPFPSLSGIQISPCVAEVAPGRAVRLEIRWTAAAELTTRAELEKAREERRQQEEARRREVEAAAAQASGKGKNKKGKGKPAEEEALPAESEPEPEQDQPCVEDVPEHVGTFDFSSSAKRKLFGEDAEDGKVDDEDFSVHAKWHIPIYMRQVNRSEHGPDSFTPVKQPLFLEVHTVVVDRVLSVETTSLDFGELSVGQSKQIPLRIRNLADMAAPIQASGLNSVGPFSILNSLRTVHARDSHTALIEFRPDAQGVRQETLYLCSPLLGRALRINLRGEGVSPVLEINPSDGKIDLGHCVEGDRTTFTVTLHNSSIFPLTYHMEPLDAPHANFNQQSPFILSPSEAEVPAGADFDVHVEFRPDHARIWPYHHRCRVNVPNQVKEHILSLTGRCHARQLYAVAAEDASDASCQLPENVQDPFHLPDVIPPPPTLHAVVQSRPPIKFTFPRDDTQVQHILKVGSAELSILDEAKPAPGSFEIEWEKDSPAAKFFSATPDKGSLVSGVATDVAFSFSPPTVEDSCGLEVGQWARTTVRCHLRGGFAHDHATEEPIVLLLEGFIQV